MRKEFVILGLLLVMGLTAWSGMAAENGAGNPRVALKTSQGEIVVELMPDKAPATVKNFLGYVDSGFYDGTLFHRVIKGFMIQGGGLTSGMERKHTRSPIVNEADNGLKNKRGTIAMARTRDPHSATSQFFINLEDNSFLDFKSKTPKGWGYAVFGRVVQGMEVVDRIGAVPTGTAGGYRDVPVEPVLIQEAAMVR